MDKLIIPFWIRIPIGVGLVLVTLLVSARPIYLIYAGAGTLIVWLLQILFQWMRRIFSPWPGFRVVAGNLLVASVLVLIFGLLLEGSWILSNYAGCAVTAGEIALLIWRFRVSRKPKRFQQILFLALIPISLLALDILLLPPLGAPFPLQVKYTGIVSIKGTDLAVNHEITIDRVSLTYVTDARENAYRSVRDDLEQCGWREELEGTFSKADHTPIVTRWFPFETLNSMRFPLMSCKNRIFSSLDGSAVRFRAPRYEVGKTDPESKIRSESLEGETETIEIPMSFSWDRPPSLDFQLVSPFLQNRLGATLLESSAWGPLKWVILAICGVFSEQIRKGLIIPFVKWIFAVLHLKFKQEKNSAELSEDSDFESENLLDSEGPGAPSSE